MVTAGITQGLMWRKLDDKGNLFYPDFIETVVSINWLYWIRVIGGLLFLAGYLIMLYNIIKTIQSAPADQKDPEATVTRTGFDHTPSTTHGKLEGMGLVFSVLAFLAIIVGSIVEIYPLINLQKYISPANAVSPYTPLEIAGRDIYIREGCYVCHSQMIRPMKDEYLRYGKASTIEESMYDRPFQWGSRRTGPDLARVGKKYPNLWHYNHMMDPRTITPKSIMPSYPWLKDKDVDFYSLRKKISVLKMLGTPYEGDDLKNPDITAQKQAAVIAQDLVSNGAPSGLEKKEIVALIAYLQSLGQKGKQ